MADYCKDSSMFKNKKARIIAALIIGIGILSIFIGVMLWNHFNKKQSTENKTEKAKVDDEKVCSKMEKDFVKYLEGQKQIKILKFKFDSAVNCTGMGLGEENLNRLAVVNAANTDLLPGLGGLNNGITSWVRDKGGVKITQGEEVWHNLNKYFEDQTQIHKKLGLAACSDFNNGIILHVIGPQASLVGNSGQCKNLSEVAELLTNAYKDCLSRAKSSKCSHIIFTVISSGIFCSENSKAGFKKSEFLSAVQNAVKKFIEKEQFEDIKVYFNI